MEGSRGTEPLPSGLTKEARFSAVGAPSARRLPRIPIGAMRLAMGANGELSLSTLIRFDEAVDVSH